MSTWTDERHEAARARCEAATDGPWDDQPCWTGTARVVLNGDGDMLWDAVGLMNDADGAFIAHARIDLPAALDEIEHLRALDAYVGWIVGDPVPEKMPEDTGTTVSVGSQRTLSFKVLSFEPDVAERLWEEASAERQAATRGEIPDDMIERAAHGIAAHWNDMSTNESLGRQRALARAALEAALNPKENEA